MRPIRKNIASILCLAGCLLALPLSGQQALTLDECVERALQNNVRMKNAANDLSIAEEGRKSAFTKYFPSVSATGAGFLASENILQLNLAPGMGMGMMKNGLLGGVSASLPVFAGGQIYNGNKLAEVNVEKYRLLQHQSENEVRLTVEQYYWQVAMLKEKLVTLSVVEKQLSQVQDDVEAAVKAGVTNRNDLLQVQLRRNDIQSSRLTVENGLSLSRRLLAQYMGLPGDSIDVAFHPSDSLPPQPAQFYRPPKEALPSTPEYNLLQAQLKASKIEHKLALGKQLPTVAIGGGYMYDNLLDFDQTFWAGFLTINIPISGWWGGSHDIKQKKLAMANAENSLRDQSELLLIRMRSAWDDLNEAYRQVEIARRSIEQSTENLRLNTDYYHAGTSTMSDLLDAQTLFQQSRDKYVEAWAQYEVKKRQYLLATGR